MNATKYILPFQKLRNGNIVGKDWTIARLKSSKTNTKLCSSMSSVKGFRCLCPSGFAAYSLCLRVSSHLLLPPPPLSLSHSGWFHPLCAALPRRCLTTLASSTSGVSTANQASFSQPRTMASHSLPPSRPSCRACLQWPSDTGEEESMTFTLKPAMPLKPPPCGQIWLPLGMDPALLEPH